jgi:hypothetical protein
MILYKCIKTKNGTHDYHFLLTLNKTYKCLYDFTDIGGQLLILIDDAGDTCYVPKELFISLDEERDIKLGKLLD